MRNSHLPLPYILNSVAFKKKNLVTYAWDFSRPIGASACHVSHSTADTCQTSSRSKNLKPGGIYVVPQCGVTFPKRSELNRTWRTWSGTAGAPAVHGQLPCPPARTTVYLLTQHLPQTCPPGPLPGVLSCLRGREPSMSPGGLSLPLPTCQPWGAMPWRQSPGEWQSWAPSAKDFSGGLVTSFVLFCGIQYISPNYSDCVSFVVPKAIRPGNTFKYL